MQSSYKNPTKRFNKIVKEAMKLTPTHWIAIAAIALTFLAFILYHTQFSDFARCKNSWTDRGYTSEVANKRCVQRWR